VRSAARFFAPTITITARSVCSTPSRKASAPSRPPACEVNVDLHSIVLDGVYVDEVEGRPGFRPLPAPTTAELHALTVKVARKVIRLLRRRGLLDETVLEDAAADEPALTDLLAESVAFPRARIVDPGRARPATDPVWLGSVAGFNLHAGVALSALDREGRERLCKYLLRPPLSDDRLSLTEDGRVALALKTPWRDGTVALLRARAQGAGQGGDRAIPHRRA
jgi:hypothetical protein